MILLILSVYPREMKIYIHKKSCIRIFIMVKDRIQPKFLPPGKWINEPWNKMDTQFSQFSRSVVSNSLRPHESQHARPRCPSSILGVHSDSRPSSQWCHPAISSSIVPFFSCLQSLPASESGSFNYELHHSRKSTFLSQQMLDFQQAQQLFLLFLLRFEVGSGSIYTWPESTLFLSRQTFVRLLVS